MVEPDWKYTKTVQKRVRIIKVDAPNQTIDVFDLDQGFPLSFNVNQQIDLKKVKRAKIYQATVEIYEAEFTKELEWQMIEASLHDHEQFKRIQDYKKTGAKPTRFDLISLKH
ncbi:MAG: hypothetical protein LBB87_05820 [Nitrososphaerota archaeon]|jgi:hypothetical protein|nr:hypothetical protein [Nitrososphaerota archaeon]